MRESRVPVLAFSTLACPEWDAATVVARAVEAGWGGIEWRGGPDGTIRPDWSSARRRELRRRVADAGLTSIAVTAYTTFVSGDRTVTRRSVDDAVAHAELAAELGAPTIRVFLGIRDDDAEDGTVADRVVAGLRCLLEKLQTLGVGIAIEPHDDHVRASSIAPILDRLADDGLGVVWDIGNAWSVGEAPADGLGVYAGRIRYVQVKDGTGRGDTWRLCGLGDGDVPIDVALGRLAQWCAERGQPLPPISLEWERAWHPELAPAAVVLGPARRWLEARIRDAISSGRRPTAETAG